jgi:hypothetical protein
MDEEREMKQFLAEIKKNAIAKESLDRDLRLLFLVLISGFDLFLTALSAFVVLNFERQALV